MRTIAILALTCVSGACATDADVRGSDEAAVESTSPGVAPACDDACASDGTFDFHVWGERLRAWNGRRVVAAAIEPRGPDADSRAVLISTVIRRGHFSLLCPTALRENYNYPAYAAYVDVNRDGRCSPGDVGHDAQLFGWNFDVDAELSTPGSWAPVTSLAPPIQRPADDFCSGYFE